MKNRLALLGVVFSCLVPNLAFPQGSLTPPPGVPAPTMKTLTEISGQIATLRSDGAVGITTAPFTISAPGVYYLKNDVSVTTGDAIIINADDVTLDLGGFAIRSTASPASGSGVAMNTVQKNIHIKNGTIRGTTTVSGSSFTTGGFNDGILTAFTTSRNVVISDIRVHGVAQNGINLPAIGIPSYIVERCVASVCGFSGIVAHTVRGSGASECGGIAITGSVVSDSAGTSVGTAPTDGGIFTIEVSNSRGTANAGTGITATDVTNCRGSSTSNIGISATNVSNSSGTSSSGIGILASGNVTNSNGTSTTGASGISTTGTASFSRGTRNGGVAINATIAIGCTVSGSGTVSSANKFLGTP